MDPRSLRSRKAIKNALCRLVSERDFSSVKALDVAREAGINRSTFYLHYRSLDAVLYEIEDDLIKNVVGLTQIKAGAFEDYIKNLAASLLDYSTEIRTVLSSSYAHFQRKLEMVLLPLVVGLPYASFAGLHPEEEGYVITFLLDGSIGTVASFFRNHGSPSKEDAVRLAEQFLTFFGYQGGKQHG